MYYERIDGVIRCFRTADEARAAKQVVQSEVTEVAKAPAKKRKRKAAKK